MRPTLQSDLLKVFRMEGAMFRYSNFVPRLYNYCLSLGFEAGKIMPSRAFCSDESQGFPVILIAKHFGTFPFNHGLVGGVVATDRHGPHAHHGKDVVIIHASHVGYDPAAQQFGSYRRLQAPDGSFSAACGKIERVLSWYQKAYQFASEAIEIFQTDDGVKVAIDNHLLDGSREFGLFLDLKKLILSKNDDFFPPVDIRCTATVFRAAPALIQRLDDAQLDLSSGHTIGDLLQPDLFHFKHAVASDREGYEYLENNLKDVMPYIVTSPEPMLAAALVNTQSEFDRTYRTIVDSEEYAGKNMIYISGLNIDISPEPSQIFPLTKFIPWAAYVQKASGEFFTVEQEALIKTLRAQSVENPEQIDLEAAIAVMQRAKEVEVHF